VLNEEARKEVEHMGEEVPEQSVRLTQTGLRQCDGDLCSVVLETKKRVDSKKVENKVKGEVCLD